MKAVMTKRQQQAEQTKLLLFNTAHKLLEERGFENITIRDIVEAANVSIGTFYNYYSSKMDVFYATYQIADQYFEDVVAPQLTHGSCGSRIMRFFDYYSKYCSEVSDYALTRLLYNADNPYFNRESKIGMRRVLSVIVQEGKDSGELVSDESVDDIVRFFMVSVRGMVYDWCTRKGEYDLISAINDHVKRLLRAYDLK